MALSKIWVLAEATDGKVTTTTLELLTKARSLADTVEAVYAGGDADAIAGQLGEFGASKVYTTGDLAGALPGVPVSGAIAALVEGGNAPDAIIAATSYVGRDIAGRLSAKLDRTVITNNTDLEVDGSKDNLHRRWSPLGARASEVLRRRIRWRRRRCSRDHCGSRRW